MSSSSRPGCAELAVHGGERDVQLLGLLPVADAGTRITPQCMHGLRVCATAWQWLLLF